MPTDESFPFEEHRSCLTLTRLSEEIMPRDGSLGRVRKFRKDIDIWQPTDASDRIYFLQRGKVEICSGDPQARDILLQAVTAGEPFGELCFCAETGGVRNTVARTLQPVTVLEIEYVAFLKYVRASDQVLSSLLFTICQRLSDCETRMVEASGRRKPPGHSVIGSPPETLVIVGSLCVTLTQGAH